MEKVGASVKGLKVGDWVIPAGSTFGTWQQEVLTTEDLLVKVPNDIPAEYAATLNINPATALRLLKDFENLQPGECIVCFIVIYTESPV